MRPFRLLALILLTVLAFSACTWKGGSADNTPVPTEAAPSETPWDETPDAEATFRRSTLYYLSDEGFLVPVTKLIPWEEGIAKACLSYMIGTESNEREAAKLGLRTVIPSGAELSLAISERNATVNITGLEPLPDAGAELDMLEAIVNTLTEFSTVDTVTVTVEGEGGRLKHGTELPVKRGAYPLNPETDELETLQGAMPVTLYFPNSSGAVTVPVTRYMQKTPTVYSLARALIDGARVRGLRSCFPENTLLLGAAIENGTVTVNLSEDFRSVAETEGLYSLACSTLWLTLAESYDFERLVIQVNGEVFAPETFSPPESVN